MRQNSIYRILEAVDLVEDTSLAEINKVLGEESSHDVQLVDTRFTVVGSKGPGYNGNIMVYSEGNLGKRRGKLESLLSSYTKEDEVTLNCVGGGFEHHYYEPVNL